MVALFSQRGEGGEKGEKGLRPAPLPRTRWRWLLPSARQRPCFCLPPCHMPPGLIMQIRVAGHVYECLRVPCKSSDSHWRSETRLGGSKMDNRSSKLAPMLPNHSHMLHGVESSACSCHKFSKTIMDVLRIRSRSSQPAVGNPCCFACRMCPCDGQALCAVAVLAWPRHISAARYCCRRSKPQA